MMAADSLRATTARIAELEEENTQLRERLGLAVAEARQTRLLRRGLRPQTAALAVLLYARRDRPVNYAAFDIAAPSKNRRDREPRILDVQVCHLRKRLPAESVVTLQGLGYLLTPAGRAVIAEWLGDAA